jgi:hypothetical protein
MRAYSLGLLIGMLCATEIAVADSEKMSNAVAAASVVSSRIQEFTTSATTSKYSLAVNRSLDDWSGSVLGTAYVPIHGRSIQDTSALVAGLGQIRKVEATFMKGELSPSNCVVRLKYYEAPSAEALRKYFIELLVPTYSAGMPPINKTYGIGDTVLSWIDLVKGSNRIQFIAFFNNVAVKLDITSDGEKSDIDTTSLMRNLEHWVAQGEGLKRGP